MGDGSFDLFRKAVNIFQITIQMKWSEVGSWYKREREYNQGKK